jgi:hypothetical protein
VVQCRALLRPNLLTALIYILLAISAMICLPLFLFLVYPAIALAQLNASSLTKYPNVLSLTSPFNPVKAAYWTALPHHRRTPFAVCISVMQLDENPSLMLFFLSKVSPDGASVYLAYLDNSETDVHIQRVHPTTFIAVGPTLTVKGAKEGAWLPFLL